jgi:hypothetical protein
MSLDYSKVWNTMNELESVTAKIVSAREILSCAIDAQESGNANRTETLLYAVDEYLQYYLAEFDTKFQDAWKETVKKLKQEENDALDAVMNEREYYEPTQVHSESYYDYTRNDPNRPNPLDTSPLSEEHLQAKIQANSPYNDGFTREYYQEIVDKYEKKDKVVKWQLPVEEVKDCDTDETEYFITFPDDLLEAANLRAGDDVEWVDRGDGSFLLQKVTKPLGMDEC